VCAHPSQHSYADVSLALPSTSVALPARTNFLTATHVHMWRGPSLVIPSSGGVPC
jgi:hypothetical protein